MSLSTMSTPGVPEASGPAGAAAGAGGYHGLYDGFEAYRTVNDDDRRQVLAEGLVVLDTNVLLHLYRYGQRAAADLFAVLEAIGERLWEPHQVMLEFWHNRDSVLRDPHGVQRATNQLDDLRTQAVQVLRQWSAVMGLDARRFEALLDALVGGFRAAIEGIADLDPARPVTTAADPVLRRLEPLLEGRVGLRPTPAERAEAVEVARIRVERRIPPGYRDVGKSGDLFAGDYLVWSQLLVEARVRGLDVLFVTGDSKEDWWRRERGRPVGPREELVTEMREVAGVRLFQFLPQDFLAHGRAALGVAVPDSSVAEVARVERLAGAGDGLPGGGWTPYAIGLLLERLEADAPQQAAVLRRAVLPDGRVRREDVHAIGKFHELSPLRDFSRPVLRITQDLREKGVLPRDAVDPLVDEYDDLATAYRTVAGFRVPRQVVPVLAEALAAESRVAGAGA
jgi:hypothetical protein